MLAVETRQSRYFSESILLEISRKQLVDVFRLRMQHFFRQHPIQITKMTTKHNRIRTPQRPYSHEIWRNRAIIPSTYLAGLMATLVASKQLGNMVLCCNFLL